MVVGIGCNRSECFANGLHAYFVALAHAVDWEAPDSVTTAPVQVITAALQGIDNPLPYTFNGGDHILHFGDTLDVTAAFWIEPRGINGEKLHKLQEAFKLTISLMQCSLEAKPTLLEIEVNCPRRYVIWGGR